MSGLGSYEYLDETAADCIKHELECAYCQESLNSCEIGQELERLADEAEDTYDGLVNSYRTGY